jgi:hypothetical protein
VITILANDIIVEKHQQQQARSCCLFESDWLSTEGQPINGFVSIPSNFLAQTPQRFVYTSLFVNIYKKSKK